MPRSATGEVLQVTRGRSSSAPQPPNSLQMATRRLVAMGADIKQAIAGNGPSSGRIRELAVLAGKQAEARDALQLEQTLAELERLLKPVPPTPVLDTAGKAKWEEKAAVRNEVGGKLQALEGWAVEGAAALRKRLDDLAALATDERNAYAKAAEDLEALRADVARLHTAESDRRKQERQQARERDARELEDKGSGLPELFARDEYDKAAAVQQPRLQEAQRRCAAFPELSAVLAPVTQGWERVQQAVAAENFLSAGELLAALVGPIDTALAAAWKAEVVQKRKALDQYAQAQAIAAAPPPGDVLKAEVDDFKAKDKAVTDAEAADNPKAAEGGHAALGISAKALVGVHALWTAYDQACTAAVKQQLEAADRIVAAAPSELATPMRKYSEQHALWQQDVTAHAWKPAAEKLAVLSQHAASLVSAHTAWKPYGDVYTAAVAKTIEEADDILLDDPPELKSHTLAYGTQWMAWEEAVKKARRDGSWAAAATATTDLARLATKLIDQHAKWKDYLTVVNSSFGVIKTKAMAILQAELPDLSAETASFKSAYLAWRQQTAPAAPNWVTAKAAASAMLVKANALIAANLQLFTNYTNAYSGARKAAIERAGSWRAKNLPGLAAATKVFAPVYDPWQKNEDENRLAAVTAGVGAVYSAALVFNVAVDKFERESNDFVASKLAVIPNYDLAKQYCSFTGAPPVKFWPADARAFVQADELLDQAKDKGDWAAAEAALTPLKAAIGKVVPAYEHWLPYAIKAYAAAPFLEKARLAATSAPAGVAVEKAAFEAEVGKIDPAAKGGNWVAALAAVNQAEPLAKALLAAVANLAKLRAPFDKAVAAGAGDVKQAQALVQALPPGLAADDKVAAFALAVQKLPQAEQEAVADTGKWPQAVLAAQDLTAKAKAVVSASGTLNAAITADDRQRFDEKLKALAPRLKKADESWMLSPHVQALQQAAKAARQQVDTTLGTDFLAAAGGKYDQLVAALEAMEKAKAAYDEFKQLFDAAEAGPVRAAQEGGDDPAALAAIRDQQLDAMKNRIMKIAAAGQTSLASRMVATWEEDARGWQDKWAEAQRAHAALNSPSPDPAALKALADAPGGGKVFDDLVAALPADSTPAEVFSQAMKARFGVELTQFKKKQTQVHELEPAPGNAPDKSVKQLYKLMATVPDSHVKGALERVTRYTDDKGGGSYAALTKQANLYCGRAGSRSVGDAPEEETLAAPDELPEIDEDCKPADGPAPKQFNFTALHEVGHAIDDAANFMGSRRGDDRFGGWLTSSAEDAAAAAADKFGYDKDYIVKVLANKGKPLDEDDRPDAPGVETPQRRQAREAAENWCALVVQGGNLWWKGSKIADAEIGGRVYQEAYSNQWYSYPAAARKQGITGYQFRSPGEWFAELYAAFYSNKLKETHPAVSWLKDIQRPGA